MKTKILLFSLLIILATTGSTCINDGFLVSVNLPINPCFQINGVTNTNFNVVDSAIVLAQLIDPSYQDNVTNARYYDIRISVLGAYSGNVSGSVYIQYLNSGPQLLLTYSGSWSDFVTAQSLLGGSTHISSASQQGQPYPGVGKLLDALRAMPTAPGTKLTFSSIGTLSQIPVPNGLSVCVEILAQVDAKVQ